MTRMRPLPPRDLDTLFAKVFPAIRSLIASGYFSLGVEGAERVPTRGPVIYVGNHAGWFTLDTVLGAMTIVDHLGIDRLPWGAVQDQLLRTPVVGRFFTDMGGFPSSWLRAPDLLPPEMQIFSVYPEGTEGNCKPFWHAYQMARWSSSFVRLAIARRATIVPIAVLGGEECLPVASTIRITKPLLGTILPLPVCLVPLPSKWKFVFHDPVRLDFDSFGREADDSEAFQRKVRHVAASIRATVQGTLDREAEGRSLVRFGKLLRQPGAITPLARKNSAGVTWTSAFSDGA